MSRIVIVILIYHRHKPIHHYTCACYDPENHRTQSQFDRHRVTKLVLFEFVNNFMSLFYIAFYIQDMEMLKNVSIY
jgi:anoctamin-10